MNQFVFHNPTKVIFGQGCISNIGEELARAGFRKILLTAGGGSIRKNGVYSQVVASLGEAGVEWEEFWGITPNPDLAKVRAGVEAARACKAEALLSVGGGSVIDATKAMAAGCREDDIWAFIAQSIPVHDALPHFTVLTISATGSEMNPFAVVTNEAELKKWPLIGPALFPRVTIIDPSVQLSLPWQQTVNGAVDAISHVLEFYFLGSDQETTLAIDEALLRTVIKAAEALREEPADLAQRSNLAWAATLALNGLSGAQFDGGDWTSHTLEHAVSALHPEVAHGAGLAVLFPAWIAQVHPQHSAIFDRWARNVFGATDANAGLEALVATYHRWGAPLTLGELGLTREEIPTLVELATQGRRVGRVALLEPHEVRAIYERAF